MSASNDTATLIPRTTFDEGQWRFAGEAERRPGLTARAARAQAIQDATAGTAKPGEVYAAVLRSEWRMALDN